MAWTIYDYLDERVNNPIKEWLDALSTEGAAKVQAKIVMLRQYGGDLPKGILSDTDDTSIKKLRATGRLNPRLYLCYGPVDRTIEFTLLIGVLEKDNKVPAGTLGKAIAARARVLKIPLQARQLHEFEEEAEDDEE